MKYNLEIISNGANSNIITINGISYVTSYESTIAEVKLDITWKNYGDKITLGKDYNYSRTTSKHLTQGLRVLGIDIDEFKKDLKKGLIKIEG